MNAAPNAALLDEPSFPENAQMLRYRGLGNIENLDQGVDITLSMVTMGELLDDANSDFMPESTEDFR